MSANTKTIIEIVAQHLTENGFTGLVNPDIPCGCELSDLVVCQGDFSECRPGHKHMDPRPENIGNWAVFLKQEPPTAEQWDNVEF
jgi:hypothetical protein